MNRRLPIIFVLIVGALSLSAQGDEEIIISSSNIEAAERLKGSFKVKPLYRHIDSIHQRSLLLIAFRPELRKFPGQWDIWRPRPLGIGQTLTLRYERLLKDYRFSVFAENSTRLHSIEGSAYDYGIHYRFRDISGINRSRGGEFDTHYSTFHLGARFFYRQRERVRYGVSGKNPFSEYLFLRVRDVLSYARRTTTIRSVNSDLLEREVKERKWIMAPGYIELGWGIQRKVMKRVLIDLYAGGALKLSGKRGHASGNVFFDLGLNVGFILGKQQLLK